MNTAEFNLSNFSDELCVYQGHGVCKILPKMKDNPKYENFIQLEDNNHLKILVPPNESSYKKFRPLISKEEALALQEASKEKVESKVNYANWNRKFRYYMTAIMENKAQDLCKVIQEIQFEESVKELNYSQKNILKQCRDLLHNEIQIALKS